MKRLRNAGNDRPGFRKSSIRATPQSGFIMRVGPSFGGSTAVVAALAMSLAGARAQDLSKYPDWSGQWLRIGGIQWDPSKPLGRAQQPPLTPEYQALFDASLADQSHGGQGNNARFTCIPHGMPRAMTATFPFEIIIMRRPPTSCSRTQPDRRIYTDGRNWPQNLEPAFAGYSIGHWVEAGGRFDLLEVETRNMKGPRDFETSGLPVHEDNQTVVKERLYLDGANKDILHDEVNHFRSCLDAPLDGDQELPPQS